MLEGLDGVDWSALSHAYGPAEDVPRMLRGLRSADLVERDAALDDLYGSIFHQGSRYDATPRVVPFLFELLLDAGTPDREKLVYLVTSLAFGFESSFLPFGVTRDALFPADGQDAWTQPERDTYDAVAGRITTLVPLLRESDALAKAVAYALAWFPELGAGSVDDVRRACDGSSDEATRATIFIALAMLARHRDGAEAIRAFLTERHRGGETLAARAAAAAGLVILDGVTDDVVRTIGTAITSPRDPLAIPWREGDFQGYLGIVLAAASAGREEEVVSFLVGALTAAHPGSNVALSSALLHVARPSPDYRTTTELQRRALRAIADHGLWEIVGATFANYAILVRSFGLPGDRDDFRGFVDAAEATARGETVEWAPRRRVDHRGRREQADFAWPFALLSGTALAGWLLLLLFDRDFLPASLFGWSALLLALAAFSVSAFFIRRAG